MSIRKNHLVLGVATVLGLGWVFASPDRGVPALAFLTGIAGLSWAFVVLYGWRSRWRATAAGRAIMRLVLCMGLICTHGVVTVLTDAMYPGRSFVRPLLMLGILLALLDLFLTMIRLQRNGADR